MMKLAKDVRIGDRVIDPFHGTFTVFRTRFHYGQGVEIFDQDDVRVDIFRFNAEIETV